MPARPADRGWSTSILIVLFFLSLTPAPARSLEIVSFHSQILVQEDRNVFVVEEIQPRFTGKWNGIYRMLPIEYHTPRDRDFDLDVELISIRDDQGNDLRYEESSVRHYLEWKIWIPGAEDTTKTVRIRYRVGNAVQFFEEHDELYWNVTGDEWQIPIRRASAAVSLPEAVTGIRANAFTGPYRSREESASIDIIGSRVRVATESELGIHEGLTVAVAWDPGVVARPTAFEKLLSFLWHWSPLLLPLGVFFLMYRLWDERGRDPEPRSIMVKYEPPEELTPAEAGTLIDHYPNLQDLTATVVDLAVRGYLEIEETEKSKLLGLWTDESYAFEMKGELTRWSELVPHERKIMEALFDGGSRRRVKLEDLKNEFYKHLPEIRERVFDSLIAKNYYLKRPDKVRRRYIVIAAALLGIVYFASFFGFLSWGGFVPLLVAGGLTAAIVGLFGWFMPARTVRGARTSEAVAGFEKFLGSVESDRMEKMITAPEMFEKFLPYAMALGVADRWAKAFEDIYREPPDWYRGSHLSTFHATDLASSMGRLSQQTGTAFSSSPRSSGGSGTGGGGFSGGGFGGGGGGGF